MGPPGFAATPGYVDEVVDAAGDEAYRFSVSVFVAVADPGGGGEFATGAIDGDESNIRLDPSAMLNDPPERDISWELITTDEAMYLHYPPETGPRDGEGVLAAIADLDGDRGRIDLDRLDGITGRQMERTVDHRREGDPRHLLELLRSADDVDELGDDVVDGVPVTGLTGDVDLRAALDVIAMGGIPDDLFGRTLDMSTVPVLLEMWIDERGRVDATDAFVAAYHHEHGSTPDPEPPGATTTTTGVTTTTTTPASTTTRPDEPPFYATDFGSGQAWGPAGGAFAYRDGRLVAHVGAGEPATSYAPSPPFPVNGNFRVEVDVEKVGPNPTAAAAFGIECAKEPDDDIVDIHQATIDTDGSWALRWVNGLAPDHLDEGVFLDGDDDVIRAQGTNRITLEVRNNGRDVRYRLLVNSRELTTVIEQPDHGCELVGLVVDAPPGSPGVDVAFDNLVVTNL